MVCKIESDLTNGNAAIVTEKESPASKMPKIELNDKLAHLMVTLYIHAPAAVPTRKTPRIFAKV